MNKTTKVTFYYKARLAIFISNTAAAVLMTPIAMASAHTAGVSPVPMLLAFPVLGCGVLQYSLERIRVLPKEY